MKKWLPRLYIVWAVLTFLLIFTKGLLSPDNLTHIGIIIFFFLTLWIYREQKGKTIDDPKVFFILRCVFYAAVVEGCYMISAPVLSSLRITAGMTLGHMVQNYAIDLALTLPAYCLIFYVIWRLINTYEYTPWQFAILMALGQGFGDGSRAFLFNPGLLVFLPYIMINYHAMNVAPFLAVKDALPAGRKQGFWKWVAPIPIIFITYLVSALVIYAVAAIFKIS